MASLCCLVQETNIFCKSQVRECNTCQWQRNREGSGREGGFLCWSISIPFHLLSLQFFTNLTYKKRMDLRGKEKLIIHQLYLDEWRIFGKVIKTFDSGDSLNKMLRWQWLNCVIITRGAIGEYLFFYDSRPTTTCVCGGNVGSSIGIQGCTY